MTWEQVIVQSTNQREREREGEEGGGQEREVRFRLWQWWHVCYVNLVLRSQGLAMRDYCEPALKMLACLVVMHPDY